MAYHEFSAFGEGYCHNRGRGKGKKGGGGKNLRFGEHDEGRIQWIDQRYKGLPECRDQIFLGHVLLCKSRIQGCGCLEPKHRNHMGRRAGPTRGESTREPPDQNPRF